MRSVSSMGWSLSGRRWHWWQSWEELTQEGKSSTLTAVSAVWEMRTSAGEQQGKLSIYFHLRLRSSSPAKRWVQASPLDRLFPTVLAMRTLADRPILTMLDLGTRDQAGTH